jgi:hypothetical protein
MSLMALAMVLMGIGHLTKLFLLRKSQLKNYFWVPLSKRGNIKKKLGKYLSQIEYFFL